MKKRSFALKTLNPPLISYLISFPRPKGEKAFLFPSCSHERFNSHLMQERFEQTTFYFVRRDDGTEIFVRSLKCSRGCF